MNRRIQKGSTTPVKEPNKKKAKPSTAKYECAREAYKQLQTLTQGSSKELAEIEELFKDEKYDEIFIAIKADLEQVSGLLQAHMQSAIRMVGEAWKDHGEEGLWDRLKRCGDCLAREYDKLQQTKVQQLGKIETKKFLVSCQSCESLQGKLEQAKLRHKHEIQKFEKTQQEIEQNLEYFKKQASDYEQSLQSANTQVKQLNCERENLKIAIEELETERKKDKDLLREMKMKSKMERNQVSVGAPVETSEIQKLREHARHLEMRLAAEMGSKVSSDESSLENISIRHRPMVIATEFELFCSQSWLTTKTFLDNKLKDKEQEKVEFLTEVLMISESQAETWFKETKDWILSMMQQPVQLKTGQPKKVEIKEGRLTTKEDIALSDMFRVRADLTNLSELEKSIRAKVKTSSKQKDVEKVFSGKVTEQYVSDCARLTWKMVMQRPQMKFGNDTKLPWKGNEKLLEPAWGSNLDAANCKLRYYKHPVLYHDKAVMVKGKVIIK